MFHVKHRHIFYYYMFHVKHNHTCLSLLVSRETQRGIHLTRTSFLIFSTFFKIIVDISTYSCYNKSIETQSIRFDKIDVTTHNIAKFNPPLFLNCSFRSPLYHVTSHLSFYIDIFLYPFC